MTDLPPVRDRTKWKKRPAPWELVTELRIADLVREAEGLDQAARATPAFAALAEALGEAWHVVAEWKGGPWTWWSGSRIERAWNDIHRAEAALLTLDPIFARTLIPRLRSRAAAIGAKAEREKRIEELDAINAQADVGPHLRRLATLYLAVYAANDDQHRALRSFRNRVAVAGAVIAAILLVLAAIHAIWPGVISLCGTEEAESGTGEVRRCLDGGTASHPRDVALVLLFGALGGLLSVGFALGRVSATKSTLFHPARPQMALKAVTGAATALVAVLLLQSELLAVTLQATETAALAVAVLFGFAQHLLTRFVDQRADALLGETQAGEQQTQ